MAANDVKASIVLANVSSEATAVREMTAPAPLPETAGEATAAGKEREAPAELPNGPGAAALLAAGIGCAALGLFALLGDAFPGIAKFFTFYKPTGPLSGVTNSAIIVWLVSWYGLNRAWAKREVALGKVSVAAFILLAIGFALTFPPIMDLLQGK
jgi:hypothetical protein